MEEAFITGRIAQNSLEVLVPVSNSEIVELHRIIQKELTFGRVIPSSKQYVLDAIKGMTDQGAEGVILGCTEFPIMVKSNDLTIPIFNTTEIHSQAAVDFILS
ncbi:MAG: aspartate racemase [Roseivirga sp.]|jgi:aspartate racemase